MTNRMMHSQTQPAHFSLARGLASLGRGQDTQLVHMSNSELQGLQHLAMKTGGSLTINPHTGLYEAGWLSTILPIVAGGVLAMTGVGAPAAALMVGAADAAYTKDWRSGLAAGLGAYGGAGLAGGLAGAGASAADSGAAASSAESAAATDASAQAAGAATTATAADAGTAAAAAGAGAPVAMDAAGPINGLTAPVAMDTTAAVNAPIATDVQGAAQAPTAAAMPHASGALADNSFSTNASNVQGGIKSLGTTPGSTLGGVYKSMGPMGVAGLMAPAMYANSQQQNLPSAKTPKTYYSTTYSPGTKNPLFGQIGQPAFLGQGYGPSTPYQYTPVGYAAGGPAQQSFQSEIPSAATYQNMINQPAANVNVPSGNAQAQYLNQLSQSLKGGVAVPSGTGAQGAPSVAAAPTATSAPVYNTYNNPANYGKVPSQVPGQTVNLGAGIGNISIPPINLSGLSGYSGYSPSAASPTRPAPAASPPSSVPPMYTPTPRPIGRGIAMAPGGMVGQMVRGPGDGVSDGIPAMLNGHQPAALADGEFVVPARAVSEIGNGSTEAGSRKLYAMLDRIQNKRKVTLGREGIAKASGADKALPA